ncbi:hypothetical protein F5Y13DRAFT_196589 [Hypoxylon sp. FL1857]|nr:hypothetical protein F5Y13DRAFT_196589 [Hypoxylon sp. FL1857]
MPPQKSATVRKGSRDKAAAAADRKARAAERAAVRAEKAAQKKAEKAAEKEAARQEKIDRARRFAAKVELPTDPQDDLLVIPATQIPPHKRSANSAYDDRVGIKRRRLCENNDGEEELSLFPWIRNKTLEQPPNTFDLGLGFEDQSTDPIEALGALNKLATEIRDEILRYLLIWDYDIPVFKGWSLVYPRKKPKLDLAIMSTCKVLRLQGLRILFAENAFIYDIRDPAAHHRFTLYHGVVFEGASVPINQYGHLIRHIKINIPINRMNGQNSEFFHKAILKFLPGHGLSEPANLHTLTVILLGNAEGFLEEDCEMLLNQYFTLAAKLISKLNVQYVRILATDSNSVLFEQVIDLRCLLWKRDSEGQDLLARDCEGARRSFEQQIKLGRARVHNISTRIWQLRTFGFEEANRVQPYWKLLDKHTEKSHLQDAVSLPEDWEDDIEHFEPQAQIERNKEPRRSREEIIESTKEWLNGLYENEDESIHTEDPANADDSDGGEEN